MRATSSWTLIGRTAAIECQLPYPFLHELKAIVKDLISTKCILEGCSLRQPPHDNDPVAAAYRRCGKWPSVGP